MTQADKILLCCILRTKVIEHNNLARQGKFAEAMVLLLEIMFNFYDYKERGIECDFETDAHYITEFTIDGIKVKV